MSKSSSVIQLVTFYVKIYIKHGTTLPESLHGSVEFPESIPAWAEQLSKHSYAMYKPYVLNATIFLLFCFFSFQSLHILQDGKNHFFFYL